MESEEEYIKSKLQSIAQNIDQELPEGFGFALLTFKFNAEPDTSELMYVANADRQDIVKAMKEWIEKTENSFGNDTGKY